MITPQFDVSQDADFVYVNVRTPYIKASLVQYEVEKDLFVFSVSPYYLRLRLPGDVIEDERMTSHYDVATSTVKCRVAKKCRGEDFKDLDMITKLLAKGPQKRRTLVEEVGSDAASRTDEDIIFDEIDQELPTKSLVGQQKYGFDDMYEQFIGVSMHVGNDINELPDPEHMDIGARAEIARSADFDPDYYFADLYNNDAIEELIHYAPSYNMRPEDKDRLMRLPKRTYVPSHLKWIYTGLAQLIFAYAYDDRTTLGEATVESAWTIGKLCPMMYALYNAYSRLDPLVCAVTKRALCLPLYRHYDLAMTVWKDVIQILKGGRTKILVCLARLLKIFESDLHFCYRQIWLEDYAIWIQSASDRAIAALAAEVEASVARLQKKDLELDLDEYEEAARLAASEARGASADPQSDSDDDDAIDAENDTHTPL